MYLKNGVATGSRAFRQSRTLSGENHSKEGGSWGVQNLLPPWVNPERLAATGMERATRLQRGLHWRRGNPTGPAAVLYVHRIPEPHLGSALYGFPGFCRFLRLPRQFQPMRGVCQMVVFRLVVPRRKRSKPNKIGDSLKKLDKPHAFREQKPSPDFAQGLGLRASGFGPRI